MSKISDNNAHREGKSMHALLMESYNNQQVFNSGMAQVAAQALPLGLSQRTISESQETSLA